jgi:hypothetical protein
MYEPAADTMFLTSPSVLLTPSFLLLAEPGESQSAVLKLASPCWTDGKRPASARANYRTHLSEIGLPPPGVECHFGG